MNFRFMHYSYMDKSPKVIIFIVLILIFRKYLNRRGNKYANIIMWGLFLVYLLSPYVVGIELSEETNTGLWNLLAKIDTFFHDFIYEIEGLAEYFFSKLNRLLIALLLLAYLIHSMVKTRRSFLGSSIFKPTKKMQDIVKEFGLLRRVTIMVNDDINVPVTYGLIRPKIILQSTILDDEELLEHVLIHEMTHIKKFDIIWNHIKYIAGFFHWHNPFVLLSAKFIEEDLEILCDKLAVKRMGDTTENRRAYCLSMVKLEEQNVVREPALAVRLHPTKERILIMKKWKSGITGFLCLALMIASTGFVFSEVRAPLENRVRVIYGTEVEEEDIVDESIVRELSKKEYDMQLFNILQPIEPFSTDINETDSLKGYSSKEYSVNVHNWASSNHNRFSVAIKSTKSSYNIIVIDNEENVIYDKKSNGNTYLEVIPREGTNYSVIILNRSSKTMNYGIKIKSYRK